MEVADLIAAPSWLLFLVAILTVLYFYGTKNHGYWKSMGVPTPTVYPFIGTVLNNLKENLHTADMKRHEKLGKIYGSYESTNPVLSIGDPDLLRDVLVKDFHVFPNRRDFSFGDPIGDKMVNVITGEDWKRIRTFLTPAFSSGKLRKMCTIINNSADTTADNFVKAVEKNSHVDVKNLFNEFTMDVIATTAFGSKIDSHNDSDNPLVTEARRLFTKKVTFKYLLIVLCPLLLRIFKQSMFTKSVVHYFKNVVLTIIEDRKATGTTRNDFLQLMIDAEKETPIEVSEEKDQYSHSGEEEAISKIFQKTVSNKTLSRNEMVAQCVLFFIAGFDTTASTMSFAAYYLALNPEIQEKLIEEVDETFLAHGEADYDILKKMKYLDLVVSETLRICPPAFRTERVAQRDYALGDTGIVIPKGGLVSIPIYPIHHNPEYYPDPEKFDPERFAPENRDSIHPYGYLPFGAGPRNCVAMRFALLEIKLGLSKILRRVRFVKCPETKVPLELYKIGQLSPKDVTLKIEVRTDAPQSTTT